MNSQRLHFRPCESTQTASWRAPTGPMQRAVSPVLSLPRVGSSCVSAQWIAAHFSSPPCIETTNPREGLQFARMGLGSIVLPTFIGDHESDLTRASDEIAELAHDQWLVMHQDDRHRPAIRRTVRAICRVFQNV